jgi:hypothetical protein
VYARWTGLAEPQPPLPPQETVGAEYEATKDLSVKDLVPLLRAAVAARVADLKASGAIPAKVRATVAYDGPAYCASLDVRITAPDEWAYTEDAFGRAHVSLAASRLVDAIEELRQAYNRSTLNTSADGSRYYGSTGIEGR